MAGTWNEQVKALAADENVLYAGLLANYPDKLSDLQLDTALKALHGFVESLSALAMTEEETNAHKREIQQVKAALLCDGGCALDDLEETLEEYEYKAYKGRIYKCLRGTKEEQAEQIRKAAKAEEIMAALDAYKAKAMKKVPVEASLDYYMDRELQSLADKFDADTYGTRESYRKFYENTLKKCGNRLTPEILEKLKPENMESAYSYRMLDKPVEECDDTQIGIDFARAVRDGYFRAA